MEFYDDNGNLLIELDAGLHAPVALMTIYMSDESESRVVTLNRSECEELRYMFQEAYFTISDTHPCEDAQPGELWELTLHGSEKFPVEAILATSGDWYISNADPERLGWCGRKTDKTITGAKKVR